MSTSVRSWIPLIAVAAVGCDNSDVVAARIADQSDSGGVLGSGGSGTGRSMNATGAKSGGGNAANGGTGTGVSGAGGGTGGADAGSTGTAGTGGTNEAGTGAGGQGTGGRDGGTIPDGGTGGSPSAPCDDGNPCTTDSLEAGACKHSAVSDGRRCEDGDFCTLGDRCAGGVCTPGTRQTGTVRVLGSVEGHGAGTELTASYSGSVVTPGDDRFLFLDQPDYSPRLTEARVVNGVLRQFDTLTVRALRSIDPPVATAWDDLIAVASDTSSIQVGGDPRSIQIVSVSAEGKLSLRGVLPMGGDAFTSMVARANRLFVCTNFSFFTPPVGTLHWIDVTNPDAPVQVASGSLGNECGSLAASDDGQRVYVNTKTGVRFTDLSSWSGSGDLTFATDPIVPTDSGLSQKGTKLLVRSGDDLHLFDEPSRTELSSFSVPGAHAAGFMDTGIFVEGDRIIGGRGEYFVALYTEGGQLLAERTIMRFDYPRDPTFTKPAIGGRYVADTIDQQIFDVSRTSLQPIDEPTVGGLFFLSAGQDAVFARGRTSAQRIDVTDPAKPVIAAGGPSRNPHYGLKLDESPIFPALVPEYDPSSIASVSYGLVEVNANTGHTSSTVVERVTVDSAHHDVSAGSITLPGGAGYLLSAGDFVYRIASGHVQRWLGDDLRAGIAEPALDLDVGVGTRPPFDVDPSARMAVVIAGTNATWLDLSTEPPTPTVTPVPVSGTLKVRGHRMAVSDGSKLAFVELGGDTQVLDGFHGAFIHDVLAFDGNVAYLSSAIPGQSGILGGPAIQVVKRGAPADAALVAEIRTSATPTSLIAMDGSLVMGSAVQVMTLAPECQ